MLELLDSGEAVMMNHRREYIESGGDDREGNCMKTKSSHNDTLNHHHHHHHRHHPRSGRNSSEDPDVATTLTDKYLSSNTRHHPQAELQSRNIVANSESDQRTRHGSSNHVYNHVTDKVKSCDSGGPLNGKRRRSCEKEELENVWTEHTSSSGRTYYYNKKLDKSQWSAPKTSATSTSHGHMTEQNSAKKARTDSTPSRVGGARTDSTPSRVGGSRIDSTPSRVGGARTDSGGRVGGAKSSTPSISNKSLHYEGRSGSGHVQRGERNRGSGHSRRGSGYKDRGSGRKLKEGGVVRESSKHGSQGDRNKHRDSHVRHSRSHSGSSSPLGGGDKHGGGHTSKVGVASHPRTSSGRSHTGHGSSSSDKATPSRIYRSSSNLKINHTSPHGSAPLGNAAQLVSPTTPGSGAGSVAMTTNLSHTNLSQTLTNTQQMINQNSILIERRQKLLAGGEATPTSCLTTPLCTVSSSQIPATPPSHHQAPLAKKKLSHHMMFQGGSPASSVNCNPGFVHHVVGGVLYATPQGSPQVTMDSAGLHPLQKALLIQNQIAYSMVEPSPQTTPTGIPSHMAPYRSHPGSPILQSPPPIPHGPGTPNYSTPPGPIQPLTPLIYSVPLATSHDFEATPIRPQFCSKALQKPMSRLGYLNASEFLQFPDTGWLEHIEGSEVNVELVDKMLASFWWQHNEGLSKQVDQCQLDTMRRRGVQNSFIRGQLVKRSLMLEGIQLKTASRYTRFTQLQKLIREVDKR